MKKKSRQKRRQSELKPAKLKSSVSAKLKDVFIMFAVFFKIGLFSFGGGYAMLTLIEHEVVDKRSWLTKSELLDIFAVAESTPGAIAINIATFIGTKRAGIFGGVFATLGVVLPSFAIIIALSYVIAAVKDNKWVGYFFKGIRVGVLVLIAKAVLTFFKDVKKNWFSFLMIAAAFLLALLTDVSVIYIILGAVVISSGAVAFVNWRNRKKYHMAGTAPYYSEYAGRTYQKDEYRLETQLDYANIVNKAVDCADNDSLTVYCDSQTTPYSTDESNLGESLISSDSNGGEQK